MDEVVGVVAGLLAAEELLAVEEGVDEAEGELELLLLLAELQLTEFGTVTPALYEALAKRRNSAGIEAQ